MEVQKYVQIVDGKLIIDVTPKIREIAAKSENKIDDAIVEGAISLLEKL
jgi:hypothetical protein